MNNKQSLNNSFSSMEMDHSSYQTPNNIYTYCENCEFLTNEGNEGILQNNRGNEFINSLPDNYFPVAVKVNKGIAYMVLAEVIDEAFTGRGQLGTFPSPDYANLIQVTSYELEGDINYNIPEYRPLMNYLDEGVDPTDPAVLNWDFTTYGQPGNIYGPFETDKFNFSQFTEYDLTLQESYDGSINMIWTDNINPIRTVNTRFTPVGNDKILIRDRQGSKDVNLYNSNNFDNVINLIYTSSNLAYIELEEITYGGILKSGLYRYFVSYGTQDGNYTDIVAESFNVQVTHGTRLNDIRGGDSTSEDNTQKQVTISVKNIDQNYNHIRVYVERSYGEGGVLKEYYYLEPRYVIRDNEIEITHTGFENSQSIPNTELSIVFASIKTAKTLAQMGNRLFIANITGPTYDYIKLRDFAAEIKVGHRQRQIHIPGISNVIQDDEYYTVNQTTKDIVIDDTYRGSYYNPHNTYEYIGYWPGESYMFAIVYIFRDGTNSPAFPVRGVDNWNNDSPYGGGNPDESNEFFDEGNGENLRGWYRFPLRRDFAATNGDQDYSILSGQLDYAPVPVNPQPDPDSLGIDEIQLGLYSGDITMEQICDFPSVTCEFTTDVSDPVTVDGEDFYTFTKSLTAIDIPDLNAFIVDCTADPDCDIEPEIDDCLADPDCSLVGTYDVSGGLPISVTQTLSVPEGDPEPDFPDNLNTALWFLINNLTILVDLLLINQVDSFGNPTNTVYENTIGAGDVPESYGNIFSVTFDVPDNPPEDTIGCFFVRTERKRDVVTQGTSIPVIMGPFDDRPALAAENLDSFWVAPNSSWPVDGTRSKWLPALDYIVESCASFRRRDPNTFFSNFKYITNKAWQNSNRYTDNTVQQVMIVPKKFTNQEAFKKRACLLSHDTNTSPGYIPSNFVYQDYEAFKVKDSLVLKAEPTENRKALISVDPDEDDIVDLFSLGKVIAHTGSLQSDYNPFTVKAEYVVAGNTARTPNLFSSTATFTAWTGRTQTGPGALTGAAAGAGIGALIPFVGPIIGAGVGAAVGAVAFKIENFMQGFTYMSLEYNDYIGLSSKENADDLTIPPFYSWGTGRDGQDITSMPSYFSPTWPTTRKVTGHQSVQGPIYHLFPSFEGITRGEDSDRIRLKRTNIPDYERFTPISHKVYWSEVLKDDINIPDNIGLTLADISIDSGPHEGKVECFNGDNYLNMGIRKLFNNREYGDKATIGEDPKIIRESHTGYSVSFVNDSNFNVAFRNTELVNIEEGKRRGFYPFRLGDSYVKGAHRDLARNSWRTEQLLEAKSFNMAGSPKALMTSKLYIPFDRNNPFQEPRFPVRIMYSERAERDSYANAYRLILPQNFQDYERQYGEITVLRNALNNLIAVQQTGTANIRVEDRGVAVQGQNNGPSAVFIDTASVLSPYPQMLSVDYGTKWLDSAVVTPRGLYFVDIDRAKICSTSGGALELISDNKIQHYLRSIQEFYLDKKVDQLNIDIRTHYDNFKNQVLFTSLSEGCTDFVAGPIVSYTVEFQDLEEVQGDIQTGIPTGLIVPNDPSHPNYASPFSVPASDYTGCDYGQYGTPLLAFPCNQDVDVATTGFETEQTFNLASDETIVVFGIHAYAFGSTLAADKFELIHAGTKKATSSMNTNSNYGPFSAATPTTEAGINAVPQFIGWRKNGTLQNPPTRIAEFQADTGLVVGSAPGPTVNVVFNQGLYSSYSGAGTTPGLYQQLIWWKYTPGDLATSTQVTLRVRAGNNNSGYSFSRLCIERTPGVTFRPINPICTPETSLLCASPILNDATNVVFNENIRAWQTFYSFMPVQYFNLYDKVHSMPYGDFTGIWRHHVNDIRCNYYGQQHEFAVEFMVTPNSQQAIFENLIVLSNEVPVKEIWYFTDNEDEIDDINPFFLGNHIPVVQNIKHRFRDRYGWRPQFPAENLSSHYTQFNSEYKENRMLIQIDPNRDDTLDREPQSFSQFITNRRLRDRHIRIRLIYEGSEYSKIQQVLTKIQTSFA